MTSLTAKLLDVLCFSQGNDDDGDHDDGDDHHHHGEDHADDDHDDDDDFWGCGDSTLKSRLTLSSLNVTLLDSLLFAGEVGS